MGGRDGLTVPACFSCNARKCARTLEQFRLLHWWKGQPCKSLSSDQIGWLKDVFGIDVMAYYEKTKPVFYFENMMAERDADRRT